VNVPVALPDAGKDPLSDIVTVPISCVYSNASLTIDILMPEENATPGAASVKLVTLVPSAETVRLTLPPSAVPV
jgi:hypothetical protein